MALVEAALSEMGGSSSAEPVTYDAFSKCVETLRGVVHSLASASSRSSKNRHQPVLDKLREVRGAFVWGGGREATGGFFTHPPVCYLWSVFVGWWWWGAGAGAVQCCALPACGRLAGLAEGRGHAAGGQGRAAGRTRTTRREDGRRGCSHAGHPD